MNVSLRIIYNGPVNQAMMGGGGEGGNRTELHVHLKKFGMHWLIKTNNSILTSIVYTSKITG